LAQGVKVLAEDRTDKLIAPHRQSNYNVIMKAQIIQIGNSKGLRLPKSVLEQCHLEDELEIEVRNNELIITSAHKPRKNWAMGFGQMSTQKDDVLLDQPTQTEWDRSEWEW
jgi:antitoxin MazE